MAITMGTTSRTSADILIGDRIVARIQKGKGYRRNASRPYFLHNVALMASLLDEDLSRALRRFEATALPATRDEAFRAVKAFLEANPGLLVTSIFREFPNQRVGDLLADAAVAVPSVTA